MNRQIYDQCSYNTDLQQSVAPLSWVLDPIRYYRCDACRPELGLVGGTAVSHINGNLVDLENDLRGQTRPVTKCPAYQYKPVEGNTLSSKEYLKPVTHPDIDVSLKHMRPCQMQHFAPVPREPPMDLYKCRQ